MKKLDLFMRSVNRYWVLSRRHLTARLKRSRRVPGPPPGISPVAFEEACEGVVGGKIKKCAHQHLAGWKKGGTYRVYMTTSTGRQCSLIYKDEVYSTDFLPALDDLPIRPGPPEAWIYGRSNVLTLDRFLPKVFWFVELEPGRHFRYLLEDLAPHYRRVKKNKEDLDRAVRVLVILQQALKNELTDDDHLIRYDRDYAWALTDYARRGLERHHDGRGREEVAELWRVWDEVERLCTGGELFVDELRQPIHGDFNRSNVHLAVDAKDGARIVDWEWAGVGLPHADLGALVKGVGSETESELLRVFAAARGESDLADQRRLLRCCKVQRRLLDAAFLARQTRTGPRVPWMDAEVRRAVADIVSIVKGGNR